MAPKVWNKISQLIDPFKSSIWWLNTHAGASCAIQRGNSALFDIYITGRDKDNRSRIGHALWSAKKPNKFSYISPEPCIQLGELGSFSENGTSYPFVMMIGKKYFMYFTGWKTGENVPFSNDLGLAVSKQPEGPFKYFPKSPILRPCVEEPYGTGSSFCFYNSTKYIYELYYTSFQNWFEYNNGLFHKYCIKKTISNDGINWKRPGTYVIPNTSLKDSMICRPSMLNEMEIYFCERGVNSCYRIFNAYKINKNKWEKSLTPCINSGKIGEWDSLEQCYPFVFRYNLKEYMLYCGNEYGKGGLGIAVR